MTVAAWILVGVYLVGAWLYWLWMLFNPQLYTRSERLQRTFLWPLIAVRAALGRV